MIDKKNKLFYEPECIPEELMLRYVKNELSAKEKHKVEKHVLDCALCSDALEGLMMIEDKSRIKPILENINQKVLTIKPQTKVIWMDTRVRIAIAAGLAILIVSVFYFKNELQDKSSGKNMSENLAPKEEQKLSEKEQIDSVIKNVPQKPDIGVKDEKTVAENKPGNLKSSVSESFKTNEQGAPVPKDLRLENTSTQGGDADVTVKTADKLSEIKNENTEEDIKTINSDQNFNIVTNNSGNATTTSQTTVPTSTYQGNTNTEPLKKGKEDSGNKNKSKNDEDLKKEKDEETVTKQPQQSAQNDSYALPKPEQKETVLDDMEKQVSNDTSKIYKKSDSISLVNYNLQAKKKFDAKDYSGAAVLYEQTLSSFPNNSDALFYSAQCYIELNKTEQAIKKLDKMIAIGGKDNVEAGKYYKALALLKKNDKEGAKKLLSEVITSGGKYKVDAEKKLDSVK